MCGARCGTFEASNAQRGTDDGRERATSGDGSGTGTIWLLDRSNSGSRDWSVSGATGTRVAGTNWWRYSGRNLSFSAYHKWTVRIRESSGVYLTAVAAGWVQVPTSGTFTRNGVHIRGGARYTLHS